MNLTRRSVIKQGALALLALGFAPSFLQRAAAAPNYARIKGRTLVVLFQRGAADGCNMVVPHGDAAYYSWRKAIAVPRPGGGEGSALDLDGFFGLHPALAPLLPIYKAGQLAVVHATGSPNSTRSHFDAQDYMESCSPGNKSVADGWLNRFMQLRANDRRTLRAVSITTRLPRSLAGPAPALAIPQIRQFGVASKAENKTASVFETMYSDTPDQLLSNTGKESFEAVRELKARLSPGRYQPAHGAQYPNGPLGQSLSQIAELIKADLGLEIAFAEVGGWDTHANQGNGRGQMANRLTDLANGLAAFHRDLGDRMSDVVLLTMTEFGRMLAENGSGGTDHGHASCNFVLGGPVKGGKVYGTWPGLAREQLYEGRDLAVTTDFRDVFAEVLTRHLQASQVARVFPGYALDASRFRGFV